MNQIPQDMIDRAAAALTKRWEGRGDPTPEGLAIIAVTAAVEGYKLAAPFELTKSEEDALHRSRLFNQWDGDQDILLGALDRAQRTLIATPPASADSQAAKVDGAEVCEWRSLDLKAAMDAHKTMIDLGQGSGRFEAMDAALDAVAPRLRACFEAGVAAGSVPVQSSEARRLNDTYGEAGLRVAMEANERMQKRIDELESDRTAAYDRVKELTAQLAQRADSKPAGGEVTTGLHGEWSDVDMRQLYGALSCNTGGTEGQHRIMQKLVFSRLTQRACGSAPKAAAKWTEADYATHEQVYADAVDEGDPAFSKRKRAALRHALDSVAPEAAELLKVERELQLIERSERLQKIVNELRAKLEAKAAAAGDYDADDERFQAGHTEGYAKALSDCMLQANLQAARITELQEKLDESHRADGKWRVIATAKEERIFELKSKLANLRVEHCAVLDARDELAAVLDDLIDRYCIEGDYCEEGVHPVLAAMMRLEAAAYRLAVAVPAAPVEGQSFVRAELDDLQRRARDVLKAEVERREAAPVEPVKRTAAQLAALVREWGTHGPSTGSSALNELVKRLERAEGEAGR